VRRAARQFLLALLVAIAWSPIAMAAQVRVSTSSRHVYADIAFTLDVKIINATTYEIPVLPQMDGIRVLGGPSRSRQTQTDLTRGTRRDTATLTWTLMAERIGRVTIPAFTVRADDKTYTSDPIVLVATKPEGGDLLIVEMESRRETVYLGERCDLTLRVWIKPFIDERLQVALGSEWMWSLVSVEGSRWGDFGSVVRERMGPRGFRSSLAGEERLRTGDDGNQIKYYVFEFDTSFVPQRVGKLAVEPVAVRAGRPPEYGGAVGRFGIDVRAQPRQVSVGDPITLTLTIYDRTPGGARLDVLSPPALERLENLNEAFRVPDEPLAGVVDEHRKTFTQTIRARRADVTEIPSIPFAFFDPQKEAYEVAWSKPIPLVVEATTEVGMADVIAADAAGPNPAATGLTESAAGLLANDTDTVRLLQQQGFAIRWWHAAPVAAPPLLYLAVLAGHRRSRRLRDDHGYARRRTARRTAARRLADGAGRAEAVGAALSDYIADRCNVPAGALTASEAAERLRSSAVDDELVRTVEELLGECEHAQFAGGVATDAATLIERAEQCIARLERERIR